MNWQNKIRLKHLFTEDESVKSIRASMNAIADELDKATFFRTFSLKKNFRSIPLGDDVIEPLDYANKLLDAMYDYADEHHIWIE